VTAALIVYAIMVIASSIFWVWLALSKSSRAAASNTVNINAAADPDKIDQGVQAVQDKATELTGGVTEEVKADGQADDNGKSNDRSRTQITITQ